MRSFQQVGPLRTYLRGIRAEGKTVGFVPTMGALHEGHAALFHRAKSGSDHVVASIFVNPKQFGPTEDFSAYPRDLQKDQQFASNAGVDALFHPQVEEIYPSGFQTVVEVPELSQPLEGAHRPGHFRGVSTVVCKLLNIVRPERAYFGQKDYQQLLLIERMVRDLNIPTEIVSVPTARAADGLALSSRNAYLSPEEREAATILYKTLKRAEEAIHQGQTDAEALKRELFDMMAAEPKTTIEYVSLVNPESLLPVTSLAGSVTLVALAVYVGKTRLIDNIMAAPPGVPLVRSRGSKI